MTGAKPDQRIRTPMQWRKVKGGGFTSGTPWEPFQQDSFTRTVDGEQRDPRSSLMLSARSIAVIPILAPLKALAVGRYILSDLLGAAARDTIQVGAIDLQKNYFELTTLQPMQAHVFELVHNGHATCE